MATFDSPHPLTCQELSKQCNDVDSSSSSQLCSHSTKRSLYKTISSRSYQSGVFRKVSVGSVSETDPSTTHFYQSRLEELSKELGMLDDHSYIDDDDDDDGDDEWEQCSQGHGSGYRWLSNGENAHLHDQPDFLDEIESSLHDQVDGEIEAFRSSLHALITQQQHQCRQLWNQELEETFSKMVPTQMVSDEQSSSPGQTVPHNPGSQDTWSSDFIQSSSDQQKIEAMSTSTSSLQGDDGTVHFVTNPVSNDSQLLDAELNRLSIQLLTSALTISNALHR